MNKADYAEGYVEDCLQEKERGERLLKIADQKSTEDANISKKIIAFSLFGKEPAYCECMIINAMRREEIYPDWVMYVYHDQTVPSHVLKRLQTYGVTLVDATSLDIVNSPGTFWRFLALDIPYAKYVIFRDADSIISQREAILVTQWIESQKPFHIIRDWYTHSDLILAGLWGAYAPFLPNISHLITEYIQTTKKLHPTHADQHFLAASIWPKIKDFSLIHDSIHQGENIVAFEKPQSDASGKDALGGYRVKKYTVDIKRKESRSYKLALVDENMDTIFSYDRELKDGVDEFCLPYEYEEKIRHKIWKLDIKVAPIIKICKSSTK